MVIGLFGKWGTGKTSVINMAVNEITELAKDDENKPIIMKFAPWNYSDKDNLISMFFQSLKNKINVQDNEELKNKVGKALSDYAGAFDALSLVPVIGSGVAAILKTLAQAKGAELMECADLDMTRRILEDALIQAEKKIIIVIDDIDRLANSQIRDVFQLVKQVADFPNVIYLLAMDREVVRRALTDVHNIDGNEYLEKIIQVPFELPELKKSKLHNIFLNKLDQIINDLPGEVIYVAKVRDIVNSEFILDRNEFNNVFYLWKCFDKDGVEAYLKGLLKTEVNKLKFICAMATKWHSTNGSGWRFYPQNYSEYISQNEVYNMIQGFDKSKLNQFTDIEQIKLASFALNYNKNEMDHADEQAALNLISEWKTGKAE